MKIIFSLLVFGFGFAALADLDKAVVSKAQLDKLASEYFMYESSGVVRLMSRPDSHRCDDQDQDGGIGGKSCTDTACDMIGSHNCNDLSEIEEVGRACRGNHNGRCLEASCQRLGSHNCNDISEIEEVAALCRGHLNNRCIELACNYIGAHNCNDISEMQEVGRACRNVRASCIESVCQRVGAHNCNDISEIEQVANSCRGN